MTDKLIKPNMQEAEARDESRLFAATDTRLQIECFATIPSALSMVSGSTQVKITR